MARKDSTAAFSAALKAASSHGLAKRPKGMKSVKPMKAVKAVKPLRPKK
jgi:hypothetical protein